MKHTLLTLLAAISISAAVASQNPIAIADLPAAVIQAVTLDTPGAAITSATAITTKAGTIYKVYANIQDVDVSYVLTLNADGTQAKPIQSKGAVSPNMLPQAIQSAVATLAPGSTITAAKQTANGANVTYQVWAKVSNGFYHFVFNPDGTLAKPAHSELHVGAGELPPAVAATVSQNAPNSSITDVLKISDGNNASYRVTSVKGATTYTLYIGSDGGLTKPVHSETSISSAALPAPVLNAVIAQVSGATITQAIQINDGANVKYVVYATEGATQFRLVLGPDGGLLEPVTTKTKVTTDDLPQAVIDAIAKSAPGAVITNEHKIGHGANVFYRIYATAGNKNYRFELHADGSDNKPVHIEETLDVTQLPAKITAAVAGVVPGGTIYAATVITDGTKSDYFVKTALNGKKQVVEVDPGGVVIHVTRGS